MRARTRTLVGSFVVVVACSACSRAEQSEDPQRLSVKTASAPVVLPYTPSPTSTAAASASAGSRPGDLSWVPPASWEKVWNPSPMRKATYRVPRAAGDGEDAEVTVAQAGGTVDANVERWTNQFSGASPTRSQRKVNGLDVTIVELHGTFQGMQPPAKPGFALVGAIVGEGVDNTFFKLTGPEKTVAAARADFDRLIDSVKPAP